MLMSSHACDSFSSLFFFFFAYTDCTDSPNGSAVARKKRKKGNHRDEDKNKNKNKRFRSSTCHYDEYIYTRHITTRLHDIRDESRSIEKSDIL